MTVLYQNDDGDRAELTSADPPPVVTGQGEYQRRWPQRPRYWISDECPMSGWVQDESGRLWFARHRNNALSYAMSVHTVGTLEARAWVKECDRTEFLRHLGWESAKSDESTETDAKGPSIMLVVVCASIIGAITGILIAMAIGYIGSLL